LEIAEGIFKEALSCISILHSFHAMSFTIKGLCYYNRMKRSILNRSIIKVFANQLVQLHRHERVGNCLLSEALLFAYLEIGDPVYKKTALDSLELSLSGESIKPMEVAEKINTLSLFYEVFKEEYYFDKMQKIFNWFLGENRLHQIVYNPRTGGCFDGLEKKHVNLNQGAESTIGYLKARLTIERHLMDQQKVKQFATETYKKEKVQVNNRSLIVYDGIRNKPFIS
jgi:hypothetical protein